MKWKRFLSMFVLLVAMVTLLSFGKPAMQVEAAEVFLNGTLSTGVTWQIDTEYTLIIEGEGALNTTSVPWASFEPNIKKIIVGEGITNINRGIFKNCINVEEMVLPFVGNKAVANEDYEGVFGFVFDYTSKDGASGIRQYKYNKNGFTGYYTYFIPKTLRSVTITNDTSIPSYAFKGCYFLSEIKISNKTNKILFYAFEGCTGIENFEMYDSITFLAANAFADCENLRDIYFKGSRNAFYAIENIGSLPEHTAHFNDSGLCGESTTWETTYEDELLIDGEGAITSSGYFTYFDIIETVKIGKNITDFSNTKFSYLSKNTNFEVNAENPTYKSEDGAVYSKDGKTLVAVPAGLAGVFTVPEGVEVIANSAFENCTLITDITLPESLTRIGDSAFKNCSTLTNVFFNGTEDAWNAVSLGTGNELLTGATIVFGKYNVEYDLCGGEGDFATQIKLYNTALALNGNVPTKTGHIFKGWNTETGGKVTYVPSDIYTENAKLKLYAIWEPERYAVSYDANGGENAPAAQEKIYNVALTLQSAMPAKTGYTFVGWATERNGEPTYFPGEAYEDNKVLSLYAVWNANLYTVSYKGNGGTGNMAMSEHTYDETKKLNANIFSRVGYTFCGWALEADGEVSFGDGAEVSNLTAEKNGNVILYAVWKANTYTVTYHPSGGTGNAFSVTHVYDEAKNLSVNPFSRLGHSFKGWRYTGEESVLYGETQSVINLTPQNGGNIDLYAVWEIHTYKVLYDANGGTNAPAAQTKIYGTDLTLDTKIPKKPGHTFKGWSDSIGGVSRYQPGDTYTLNEGSVLYAVWQIDTYSVSYDARGGWGAPEAQIKTYNQDLLLSTDVPSKTGYTFMGWTTGDSIVEYASGDVYRLNSPITLYAVWSANFYTVTYDACGGEGSMQADTHMYDTETGLTANAFRLTGYTFTGWAMEKGGAKIYGDGETVVNLTSAANGSITLYAVWEANRYTVTYNPNGGNGMAHMATHTYDLKKNLNRNTFARLGHTFKGWSETPEGNVLYEDAQEVLNLTSENGGNFNLYAVWEIDTYAVRYDANGGIGAPEAQTKIYGINLILSERVPSKTGYTFEGWTEIGTEDLLFRAGGTYSENRDILLVAVWSENTYTVYYDANGGSGETEKTIHLYDAEKTLRPNSFEKRGYTFAGWALSREGEILFSDAASVMNLTETANGEVILYAVWTPKHYTIIYDGNGGTGEMEEKIHTFDSEARLTKNAYVKEGYTFLGWSLIKDGELVFDDEESVINLSDRDENVMLYAVWEINTYSVTYDLVGGEGSIEPQMKTHGIDLTLRDAIPRKVGYVFKGWSTAEIGEVEYIPEASYKEEGNKVLYAVWESAENNICLERVDETIVNVNVTAWEGTIMVAWYENGKMTDVIYKEIINPMKFEVEKGAADEIKVFAWKGTTNMQPMCKSQKISF